MLRTILASTDVIFLVAGGNAFADQSGLAGMHAQRMVGGYMCFTEHTHVGTGSPSPSKQQAIESAAQDWSSFTAFEYGTDWGHWKVATAKQTKCQKVNENWACEVQARPCRSGPRARSRHVSR